MKILAIGDIHGRDYWKDIIKSHKQDFDKVIFIGDYFDSWSLPFDKQIENFQDIIQFKLEHIDKVVLLFGNHDYHYMSAFSTDKYSGYQPEHASSIQSIIDGGLSRGLLQMCSIDDGFLFTHAGVTKTWAKFANIDLNKLEGSINKCFMMTPQMFKFMSYEGADRTGNNIWQSPIWVRPDSLCDDMIDGYTQVVGHTTMSDIVKDEEKDVVFIDCPGVYLEINNKQLICHNIPKVNS